MIVAFLECAHRVRMEEDDEAETSVYCRPCDQYQEVLGYEEVPGE